MMRHPRQAFGLFFALLAIVAQLTIAAAMPSPAIPMPVVSLADATVLCHHDGNPDSPPAPAHQSPDCLLCFFCNGAMGPAGPLATTPLLPAPRSVWVARAAIPPPSTAPPLRLVLAARPRGPPIPV
jgi:hypothetical protein